VTAQTWLQLLVFQEQILKIHPSQFFHLCFHFLQSLKPIALSRASYNRQNSRICHFLYFDDSMLFRPMSDYWFQIIAQWSRK